MMLVVLRLRRAIPLCLLVEYHSLSIRGSSAVPFGFRDQIKLAQYRLIGKKLQENPKAILALALRNLRRYIGGRPGPATSLWRGWENLPLEKSIYPLVS